MTSPELTRSPPWATSVNAVRVALTVWAVVLISQGSFASALSLVATVALTALPGSLGVPRSFETAFTIAMGLNALGSVAGWFVTVPGYNTFIHFALPMAGAPTAYFALVRLGVFPDPATMDVKRRLLGVSVIVTFTALALETIFEIYEWSSDQLVGTALQLGNTDTMTDLLAGGLGGALGGWLVLAWLDRTAVASGREAENEPSLAARPSAPQLR